jgi:transposase
VGREYGGHAGLRRMNRSGFRGGSDPAEDEGCAAPRKYPEELRERAMRLVAEAREEDPELSLTAAVKRIATRVGIVPDTLRGWCRQAEVDAGKRPGTTTSDAAKIRELERENRELKRANEILLAASSFFARELDPRLPW